MERLPVQLRAAVMGAIAGNSDPKSATLTESRRHGPEKGDELRPMKRFTTRSNAITIVKKVVDVTFIA